MAHAVKRFLASTSGATAIEYCFIASIIAMSIVAGVTSIGAKLKGIFAQVASVN